MFKMAAYKNSYNNKYKQHKQTNATGKKYYQQERDRATISIAKIKKKEKKKVCECTDELQSWDELGVMSAPN